MQWTTVDLATSLEKAEWRKTIVTHLDREGGRFLTFTLRKGMVVEVVEDIVELNDA